LQGFRPRDLLDLFKIEIFRKLVIRR
jgi:hypothetical protein